MGVCTNWAAVVARVLDRDRYSTWLETFIAANGLPAPLARQASDHEFGLNFSRAWGLWDMRRAAGPIRQLARHARDKVAGAPPSAARRSATAW